MSKPLKITEEQRRVFFSLWPKACKLRGWTASDNNFRYAWLSQTIGRRVTSLSDVGRVDEFTSVKASLLGIIKPEDFAGQMALANMGRTNLLYKIQNEQVLCLAVFLQGATPLERMTRAEQYIQSIMRARFNSEDFSTLSDRQLNQLRFTVARAIDGKRKKAGMTIAEMEQAAEIKTPPAATPEAATALPSAEMVAVDAEGNPEW